MSTPRSPHGGAVWPSDAAPAYLFNLLDTADGGWRDRALCAQTDPEVFFPERGGDPEPAKRVCARCPVRVECLDYALRHGEPYGVWGGATVRERRAMLRRGEEEVAA